MTESRDALKRPREEDGFEEPAEKRAAIEPDTLSEGRLVPLSAPVRKTQSLQTHSFVDFSTWTLAASPNGRNKYGNLNWNLKAAEYDGNVFDFHELPSEGKSGDPWSTIVWDVKAETFEGGPSDKVKVTYEISDGQETSINRFDDALITQIEKQSTEVFNQKTPIKRELLAGQHYKSALVQRSETRGPRVKMTFVVRNSDPKKLGIMHYFKLNQDGETYEKTPIVARGWTEIEPLIAGHQLRGAKMRATIVRCWSINVMKKEVYPMMEIKEMWVREPKGRGASSYTGLSEEQQALMNSLD